MVPTLLVLMALAMAVAMAPVPGPGREAVAAQGSLLGEF